MRAERKLLGFTLVELVVVISIMAIIGAGAAVSLSDAAGMYRTAALETELSLEGFMALERIASELRASAGTPKITGGRISFNRPSAAPGACEACVDNSTFVTFVHTPEDNTLWRETAPAGRRALAGNVAAFAVTAEENGPGITVYTISLTMRAEGRGVTLEMGVFPPSAGDGWVEIVR
ncbi:MAG: PulJ/GspJ family protein [Candidatus Nitrospinota bacterium M3_3B_026]